MYAADTPVEVRLRPYGPKHRIADHTVANLVRTYLTSQRSTLRPEEELDLGEYKQSLLDDGAQDTAMGRAMNGVERVWVGECSKFSSS